MGISFKTGLYYAMGLALVMEGVMSAAYHICKYLRQSFHRGLK